MIIDCISDLHGCYPKFEGGDLLIVAGDLTAWGEWEEYFPFFQWLRLQNYKKKILVAGNHDYYLNFLYEIPGEETDLSYLCDSGTEFEGLKIRGSPWIKRFEGMNPNTMAFTVDTEEELEEKWKLIPDDVDILVTHTPSRGILDETKNGLHAGSGKLYCAILDRPSIKLHVFGHIHESYGFFLRQTPISTTNVVNASHVNTHYKPVNKPIRIII